LHRLRSASLASCVNAALAGLEWGAREKQVQIITNIPGDLPQVRVDPDSFREVLSNLISNAIKYNRPEGKVYISAHEQGDRVVLEVEDTGLGVDEKEIPFIFEQFYRGKAKEIRNMQGTGIGLAIVQKILRAHGGHVEVRSRQGGGSIFSVHIDKARG